MNLVVDGHSPENGCFTGDGQTAPFVVFDVDQQKIIAGPFHFRYNANIHKESILAGMDAWFDPVMLDAWLVRLDEELKE